MNGCKKTIILSFGTLKKKTASNRRIILKHTVGDSWDMVHLKSKTHRIYFTNTSSVIAEIGEKINLIQEKRLKQDYTLGNINILELKKDAIN